VKTKKPSETVAIFRVWENGNVIAFFPEVPASLDGSLCQSYEHVGQHGGADYLRCVGQTRPATLSERWRLTLELREIGYTLRPARRATRQMHDTRRREAKRMR